MNQDFIEALRALEKEKGINKDVLIEAIETALVTAAQTISSPSGAYPLWPCTSKLTMRLPSV